MNASPNFRFYLALVLLALLGLAIRVQNGADVTTPGPTAKSAPTEAPTLLAQQ